MIHLLSWKQWSCSSIGQKMSRWKKSKGLGGDTVDVKKTFPKSFAVPPFNGVRTVKRQNGNGKRPFTVCPFPRASLSARVPLPLSLSGLRYNMEVAKRILTRSKAWERPIAPTVHKKSRRSRPQSSQPRLLSARLTSCEVADVNGSDRTVERRSARNGETVQR